MTTLPDFSKARVLVASDIMLDIYMKLGSDPNCLLDEDEMFYKLLISKEKI